MIHSIAKSNIAHHFIAKLEEGSIYELKGFIVLPNKENFRIVKHNNHMIELDGSTIVNKTESSVDGFVKYHFEFMEFEDIKLSPDNDIKRE